MNEETKQALLQIEPYQIFHQYRLLNVYGRLTPQTEAAIVHLWQTNRILPRGVNPYDRAKQVVLLTINETGEPVGVNTIYTATLAQVGRQEEPGALFFFYRMFVRAQDRVPHLCHAMTNSAYDVLRDLPDTPEKPKGVMIVSENRKLERPGIRSVFVRNGYREFGADMKGRQLYRRDF